MSLITELMSYTPEQTQALTAYQALFSQYNRLEDGEERLELGLKLDGVTYWAEELGLDGADLLIVEAKTLPAEEVLGYIRETVGCSIEEGTFFAELGGFSGLDKVLNELGLTLADLT